MLIIKIFISKNIKTNLFIIFIYFIITYSYEYMLNKK